MNLNAHIKPNWLAQLQRALARVIRWVNPRGTLWWDVATFTRRGLICATCGVVSHTERHHITHDCEETTWPG